jgi:hypothetical protein
MSLSKPIKKRKIEDEHRIFQEKWEIQYLCCEFKQKIICLICKQTISVPKEYNIRRHYDIHRSKYDQFTGNLRTDKLRNLKSCLEKQQNIFHQVNRINEDAVKASFVVSNMIACHSKPFTEGSFIKDCVIKMAEIVCPDKIQTFKNISLSRNTVAERISDIAINLSDQLKSISEGFQAFSIAIDESTDIQGIAQLAIFIRGCDSNLKVTEELLEFIPMSDTTTGEDIFNKFEQALNKYDLPLSKLVSLVTDGAPAMVGSNKGLVKKITEKCGDI